MAWSSSLNNKFAKIQPKEEEKKQNSSFYDDFQSRRSENSGSIASTPSVKSTSSNTSSSKKTSTSSKQSGSSSGSKKTAPTTTFGNSTKFFKGYQTYQERKKSGNVFIPSTVMGKISNGFDLNTTLGLKAANDKKKQEQQKLDTGVYHPNTQLTSGDNAIAEKKPGFGKWLVDNLMNSVGQVNRQIASTVDFILPTAGDFGGDSVVDRVIDYYKGDSDRLAQKAAKTNTAKGGHWDTAGNLVSGTVAAIPNAVIAMMSGGTATGAAALESTASTGIGQTMISSAQQLMKNPMFWTSFAQTAGNSYDEAKADGASDLEATATAMISSLINAGVEIGSGIETIPNNPRSISTWVKGMLDEGKEEVVQGIVEQATKKAIYDQNKKLISPTDENAVINPNRAGDEFIGGAVVGGVLGAGQMGAGAAIDAYNNTVQTGQAINNAGAAQDMVDIGLKRDANTSANKYAQKMQQKQSKGADLSDWNVGRQYQKNVKAIDAENKFINDIANVTGTETQVHTDMGGVNGQFTSDNGQQRVDISANGDTSVPATVKHEFTHLFKQNAGEAYQAFEDYMYKSAMETNPQAVQDRLASLKKLYEKNGLQYTDEIGREEIVAEMTDTFEPNVNKIAYGNPNLADKVLNGIRTAKAHLQSALSSPYTNNRTGVQMTYAQLNNAEQLWNNALRQAAENKQKTVDSSSNIRFMLAGKKANTADLRALQNAQQLETKNVDAETIWKETGWGKGQEGKWRFEIDDRNFKIKSDNLVEIHKNYKEIAQKENLIYRLENMSEQERKNRELGFTLLGLDEKYKTVDDEISKLKQDISELSKDKKTKIINEAIGYNLSDLVEGDALFEAYPDLKNVQVLISNSNELGKYKRGEWNSKNNTIYLNGDYSIEEIESTLLHEIQHAVQFKEGFARGATPKYWERRREDIVSTIAGAQKNLDLWLNDIGYPEYRKKRIDQFLKEAKEVKASGGLFNELQNKLQSDLQNFKNNSKYAEQIKNCENELEEFRREYDKITNGMTAYEQYQNTAGEIEARDVEKRVDMTSEERRNAFPESMKPNDNVVFADNNGAQYAKDKSFAKNSLKESTSDAQTKSDNFKQWFGDWENDPENASKVVNDDGTPKIVYHGSYSNFSVFDGNKIKHSNSPAGSFFFTDDIDVGYSYTGYKDIAKPGESAYKGGVYPVYLDIKNPYIIDFKGNLWSDKVNNMDINNTVRYAMNNGYDGVIAYNIIDEGGQGDKNWNEDVPRKTATDYVVFNPNQIKSATDNVGTFDRNNDDIRYSVKEDTETASVTDSAAQEKVRALMQEMGVNSPSELAPDTVTRAQSKKDRNVFRGKSTIHNLMSRAYTAVVDDMHPFWNYNSAYEKASNQTNYGKENPYKLAINAKDASSRAAYIVSDKMVDYDNNEMGKGLVETITDSGITEDNYNDFNNYLVARHALEWLDPNEHGAYKNVYDVPELNDTDVVSSMVADFESKNPKFKQAAQNLYDWQRQLMKTWLVDTGVITEEQYNKFTEMYPDYVPFFREEDVRLGTGLNSGFANQGNIFKQAVGTQQKRILQPIENIMYNVASYVNHATKHGVTTAAIRLYDTLDSDPANNVLRQYWEEVYPVNPDDSKQQYFKTKGSDTADIQDATQEADNSISQTLRDQMQVRDGVVTVIDNGKKRYFRVYDNDFLNVLDNVKAGKFDGFLGIMASISRVRAALITSWNPAFSLASNPLRDFGTLITNSSDANKAKIAKEAVTAYADIVKGSDAYKQYLSMGGQYSSVTTDGMDAMKIAMQKLQAKDPNLVKRFFRLFPKLFNSYQTISDAIESSPRMAEFKSTLNKGYDFHEAFYRAKDVTTNFSRGGRIAKELNAVSNFFNASIQGVDKYFRQAKNNPKSFAIGVACLTAAELLAWAWNTAGDDEDKDEAYENLSNYTKNNFYNFYIGNGKFITIPKARESAVISSAIGAALNSTINEQEDRFKGFFSDYILSQFLPDGSVIGLSTVSDLRANEDYMGRPIVSSDLEDMPKELQYDDSTSYFAKWLGGVLKQSPKQIDHIINSEAGVFGKINRTYFSPSGQQDKATMFTFGVNSTFNKDSLFSTDQVNMFYDNKDNANKQANGYPSADNNYLDNRFTQAGQVLGILNKMYKEDSESDAGREIRRAYVNYARDNKKNPTGYSDEVYSELKDLFDTDSKVLSLPTVDREIKAKINKENRSYTFTDAGSLLNYQKDLNKHVDETYRKLLSDVGYNAMSDGEKAEALSKAKSDAVKEVKQFYIENEGSKRMYEADSFTDIVKPVESEVNQYKGKQEHQAQVVSQLQTVADNLAAAVPDKADEYSVNSLQINDIKSAKIDGKSYDISEETESKVIAAANEEHYSNIEKLMNNEINVEDVVGYTSKGNAITSKQADGTKVSLTGKMYNDDGTPRFDELVTAKIIYQSKEAAKEHAAEKYRDEITGAASQPTTTDEPVKVSQRTGGRARFTSARASGGSSSGSSRKSSGTSSGSARTSVGSSGGSSRVQFTARTNTGNTSGTAPIGTRSAVSLPNTVNPQLIQAAVDSFMKNKNVSNAVKPLENPLFM